MILLKTTCFYVKIGSVKRRKILSNLNFLEIEQKHNKLIQIARKHMETICDFEHNVKHMNDVVNYTKELLNSINEEVNADVCIISAYWHDVGRIKANKGHEKISSEMLKEEMIKLNYDNELIDKCYKAIENHKWNMRTTNN